MKYYQKWLGRVTDKNGTEHVFEASVPGNIQKDFAEYSGIDDLMFANNVAQLEECEGYTWTYETELQYEASGERVFFISEGIDYIFDILLDGEKIYSGEGMYSPVRIDITDKVKPQSKLSCVIYPHPKNGDIVRDRAEATDTCKPPVCYGWDWNPRLLTSGMWMPAYIETVTDTSVGDVEVLYDLDIEKKSAAVRFVCDSDADVTYSLYGNDGVCVYSGRNKEFTLDGVNLWWPSGMGDAYLYRWCAESTADKKEGYIGFRSAKLVQNKGTEHGPDGFPKGQYYSPITLEINGVRVFAKGSNVVSIGLFPGAVTEEDCEKTVVAAKECNMNIFRVWGGSGIMKPFFYDYCDRYGIMVWQEFMLACNLYTDDKHYLEVLRREAGSIVKSLRHHPSIVFWCGGNELFNDWSGMTEQSHPLRLLNSVCFENDPDRAFLPTSPVSGMAHGGYVFRDDEGNETFRLFQKSEKTAYTEFGVPSFAPVENLEKIIPKDELFPITPTENWKVHHAFGAWGEKRWACLDVIENYFGVQESLADTVAFSDRLQAFGYKACFEEARRQWGVCSMAINWCFNEPWITAANNSLISYPDIKKPAYEAVKEALRPVLATARIPQYSYTSYDKLEFEVWYLNDTLGEVSDKVKVKVLLGDEVIYSAGWETGRVMPMSNKKGLSVSFELPDHDKKEFLKVVLETENPDAASEYEILFETLVSKGRMMNT